MDADDARTLAEEHLAGMLERRWRHVQGVAERADWVAEVLDMPREVLVSAAWLHDLGYGPSVVDTGFHPLDGARFLRRRGVDDDVVGLVAHHSCAVVEAAERGLQDELAEFPCTPGAITDALWFCDMTVGPDGEPLSAVQRLAEIRSRYGPDDVVTRFVNRAERDIRAAVDRTFERLWQAMQVT